LAKRDLSDLEIGLIKGMLAKGMSNEEVHYYFNRIDRLFSPGRISNIKLGKYGPDVSAADAAAVDAFIAAFEVSKAPSLVAKEVEQSIEEQALVLFEKRGRSGWFLKSHETDKSECKESFRLTPENRFADPLRSIAGFANNSGGFLFFGVCEKPYGSHSVEGLKDECFAETDPSELNRCLVGALDPVPKFTMFQLDFDGKKVGVLHVEKHHCPPVIAIKNVNSEVKEGAIYFRYVGETRTIKPGELRQIISLREQMAVAEFSNRMTKVAAGTTATLDLDSGQVAGKSGGFVIDQELLSKIQFIREGEFTELAGAPTLKLVGDVTAEGTGNSTRIVRSNITSDAVLRNFLGGEKVAEPMQYLLHSAHSNREWQPIWYYLIASKKSLDEAIELLKAEPASQPSHRDAAIARLRGKQKAHKINTGRPKHLLKEFAEGRITPPTDDSEAQRFALAVQGLPDNQLELATFRDELLKCFERAQSQSTTHKNLRGAIFRAACRLDELLCRPKNVVV
jgi:Putative DNA-binding domain